jgi:hypothetical protein
MEMMLDDDGGNGLGFDLAASENDDEEEPLATSENDEGGKEPALNQGYDSENDGDIEVEENDDGIEHDSGDEKEDRDDHEEGPPPDAEEEEEEEEDRNRCCVNVVFYCFMLSL